MIPNPDLIPGLIAVLTFPRNVILTNQFGIFWSTPSHLGPLCSPEEEEVICMIKPLLWDFLEVQWLRLQASTVGDAGSIPGAGTKKSWGVAKKTLAFPFPQNECPGPKRIFSFLLLIAPLPHPSYKNLPFLYNPM